MEIIVNNKKKIEGQKPIFDFQGPTPVTIKTDQDFSSLSSSLYLAGSRVFKDQNKVLFFSTNYSISGNAITFMVDTYTENYLKYVNQLKTSFNLQFAARANGKTIFLLDKAFANPRVYVEGVPPSGQLSEFYTKPEVDDILSTNYWTKWQVAQAIADIQTMDIEILSALPPIEEAQEYTIYLVPAALSETGNYYDEYLVINQQYELVGSTKIDMSKYVRKDTDNTLSGVNKFDGYCQFTSGVSFGYNATDGASIFSQNYTPGSAPWGRAGIGSFAANLGEARGRYSFACDSGIATGERSFACGISTNAAGLASFAQGRYCISNNQYAHAEGYYVLTGQNYQHAEGKFNAITSGAHVIGGGTDENNRKNISVLDWDGNLSIAGAFSCPSGISIGTKIVQGATIGSDRWNATANTGCTFNNASQAGNYSIAQGYATKAQGLYSHAEGNTTSTIGTAYGSHAEGRETVARYPYSHVEGYGTVSAEDYQHVEGIYNVSTSGAVRVTGNGTNSNNRKNIEVLDWDGNLTLAGHITTNGKQNITLSSLSGIIPSEGKVMNFTLSADDEISFDSTLLTANNTVDFELQLIQPSTAVTVTWPSSGIIWGENGHFSSSNLAPDLTTGDTLYDFSIRWNGTRFLINLAYTEEIGQ